MSRGRKAVLALSTFALAATVALGGATAASADGDAAPSTGGAISSTYDEAQTGVRTFEARTASGPVDFRASYRISNGQNKVAVTATDRAGGTNVTLAVKDLRMVRLVNGAWRDVKMNRDTDGWWTTTDGASVSVPCVAGGLYRAQYTIWYKGPDVGFRQGTVTTSNWNCPR